MAVIDLKKNKTGFNVTNTINFVKNIGSKYQRAIKIYSVIFLCYVSYKVISNKAPSSSSTSGLILRPGTPFNKKEQASVTINVDYTPANVEDYVVQNPARLGYDQDYAEVCNIFKDGAITNPTIVQELHGLIEDMDRYAQNEKLFRLPDSKIVDIRKHMYYDDGSICDHLVVKEEADARIMGETLFKSQQLSKMSHNSHSNQGGGFMEPLLPPERHPKWCFDGEAWDSIDYIVHDFKYMCQNSIQSDSKTIFVNIGASLAYYDQVHNGGANDYIKEKLNGKQKISPEILLLEKYEQFGIVFDHIYAFDENEHVENPRDEFDHIPMKYMSKWHWMNVGVDLEIKKDNNEHNKSFRLNPWNFILSNFRPQDLIIVKMDIDNPLGETMLAKQLLNDDKLAVLIDQFYLQQHVTMKEFQYRKNWNDMKGTVSESMEMFYQLRKKGVAAHFWV